MAGIKPRCVPAQNYLFGPLVIFHELGPPNLWLVCLVGVQFEIKMSKSLFLAARTHAHKESSICENSSVFPKIAPRVRRVTLCQFCTPLGSETAGSAATITLWDVTSSGEKGPKDATASRCFCGSLRRMRGPPTPGPPNEATCFQTESHNHESPGRSRKTGFS